MWRVEHGDCLDVMRGMPDNSVDAVVTDPPYGLSFMGKRWDYDVPTVEVWAECLRLLKPGGHLLAFAGTRTQHRMAVRIEDAGFEIRDIIAWVYGSGFPKSHNLDGDWKGWGTALKPALEPITVARKPLEGTVAANVLRHGAGGINVDGCRIPFLDTNDKEAAAAAAQRACQDQNKNRTAYGDFHNGPASLEPYLRSMAAGRWPANLIHDGSDEVLGLFPQTTSGNLNAGHKRGSGHSSYDGGGGTVRRDYGGDSGSAARFFYCCPPDATCPLCCLPYAEACNTMQAWKNTLASIAEKRGWTSQATSEFIARVGAIGPASERIVPHVKSAGNLCDSCAISIAVALVATKTSAFSSEELQATLASTGSCNASILIPSLASFAELWASIDTTPTTSSLSLLFGSVRDAIASSTRQDTKGKAEPRSAPSRFAYVPKASKADRDEGCGGMEEREAADYDHRPSGDFAERMNRQRPDVVRRNHHPTVKPADLMRYLCRLVTPPGGIVLDPFTGSGSTGKAAVLEGFEFIGIEREAEYVALARARIATKIDRQRTLFS